MFICGNYKSIETTSGFYSNKWRKIGNICVYVSGVGAYSYYVNENYPVVHRITINIYLCNRKNPISHF